MKKYLALLLAVVMVLSLAGCGKGNGGATNGGGKTADGMNCRANGIYHQIYSYSGPLNAGRG